MRIAVTGRAGQVATALAARSGREGLEVISLARPDCDLENPASVLAAVKNTCPDAVINAAAWTAVDRAETEPEAAYRINATGAEAVSVAAAAIGVPVVQLSTDYVFDGRKPEPYAETDPTGPTSAYGASKLQGERLVAAANANHAVLRVAWLYGPVGSNFVRTMLRLATARDEIGVVEDQFGNPTSAIAVADGIFRVARNLVTQPDNTALRGVFHMTAAGEASWADVAEAVFVGAAERGLPYARVKRITTAEYPTPTARPANSRLDCRLIAERHGVRLPEWKTSLAETLDMLASKGHPTR
jgi:dTDP-4-dehydrorhamnose reductase